LRKFIHYPAKQQQSIGEERNTSRRLQNVAKWNNPHFSVGFIMPWASVFTGGWGEGWYHNYKDHGPLISAHI